MKSTVVFLGLCFAFSVFSRWWVRPDLGRCAQDGTRIEAVYAVEVTPNSDDAGKLRFCSIRCARLHLERTDDVRFITVRDEVTGEDVSARAVHYVQSKVPTVRGVEEPVHVFADWAAALQHIESYDGEFVENPFRTWLQPKADAPD